MFRSLSWQYVLYTRTLQGTAAGVAVLHLFGYKQNTRNKQTKQTTTQHYTMVRLRALLQTPLVVLLSIFVPSMLLSGGVLALDCGCPKTCTPAVLNEIRGIKCEQRIKYLMEVYNAPMEEACEGASQQAGASHDASRPCRIDLCNPKTCPKSSSSSSSAAAVPAAEAAIQQATKATAATAADSGATGIFEKTKKPFWWLGVFLGAIYFLLTSYTGKKRRPDERTILPSVEMMSRKEALLASRRRRRVI